MAHFSWFWSLIELFRKYLIPLFLSYWNCDSITDQLSCHSKSSSTEMPIFLECVPLKIFHHLYFLRISKVWNMLHHRSVGRVQIKECHFIFTYTFSHFFVVFHQKSLFFILISFFSWSFNRKRNSWQRTVGVTVCCENEYSNPCVLKL